MIRNYITTSVWDATHLPKFVGRDGKNNEGMTYAWIHCPEIELKTNDFTLNDSMDIGVGATMRIDGDLGIPDWYFQVKIEAVTRHYGITSETIEDWEEQAETAREGK